MTEDVSAGRLYIDAYADTTGITRGLQRRIDAETRGIRAKIKAEIQTRGIITQAKAAATAAAAAAKVKIKAEIDQQSLIDSAKAAAAAVSEQVVVKLRAEIEAGSLAAARAAIEATAADATAEIKVDADTAVADAQLRQTEGIAERLNRSTVDIRTVIDDINAVQSLEELDRLVDARREAEVRIDAETARARAEIEALRQSAEGNPIDIPVNAGGGLSSAGTAMMQLSKAPMIAGGVFMLGTAVVQLGGGLVAMASSASQAVGVLAAIPNLVGVAAQGLGALIVGFNGIGDAVGALAAADQQATTQTAQLGQAQVDTARQVAQAQRALADARHQAADSARASAEAIRDAEWSLARAQEAAREAQEGLNDAREQARERLRDLNRELRASVSDEMDAADALQTARENLQDVNWDKASSEQEKRAAEMAVRQAERDYKDSIQRNKDLSDEARKANKEGVRGSDEVQQAKDQIRDANHNVQESEEALAEARHNAADQARASAQAIADAQRAVADAHKGAAEAAIAQTAAQTQLATAMDNLSPAGRRFAEFIYGLKPRWIEFRNAVQQALLPPIQQGITKALPLLDTLQAGLVDSAQVMGKWINRIGGLLGSPAFNNDVSGIMKSNNRALNDFMASGRNMIVVLSKIAKVAGPTLVEPFAKWVRTLTRGWRESLQTEKGMGRLTGFMQRARDTAKRLWSIFTNLAGSIHGIGKAATPAGNDLLKTLDKVTAKWDRWANSKAGQERMTEFFEATKPATAALGRLAGNLVELFVKLGEGGGGPLVAFVDTLNALVEGITWLVGIPGVGKFIGWLFMLAGVGGGIGFVAGALLKMARNLQRVSGVLRGVGRFAAILGRGLLWIGGKVLPLILRLAPLVGRAVSLMFGPWGIAIALVIGAFMLLYNKVGWFRDAVQWVMRKVVDAFHWVVDGAKYLWDVLFGHSVFPDIMKGLEGFWGVVRRIFGFVVGIFRVVGRVARWLWDKAIKPAFGLMRRGLSVLWNNVYKPILRAIWAGLKVVGRWALWLWDKAIRPAWEAISRGIKSVWGNVLKPVFRFIWGGLKEIGRWAKWLWEKAIKPAWNAIEDGVAASWRFLRDRVFSPLVKFVKNDIPNAFEKAKDGIAGIWSKLKDIAANPVEFIVNTVYTNGIRKVVNAIPGVPDLPPVTFNHAKGTSSVLPGYTPGRDVHNFRSADGRIGLNLSGGEGILRPEVVRSLGTGTIDLLNRAARVGGGALARVLGVGSDPGKVGGSTKHFRRGGILPRAARTLSYFLGGVLPLKNATDVSAHGLPYYGTGASWAGDLNSPYDLASPPSPVVAWKPGIVSHTFGGYGDSHGRYGNHVVVDHGGQNSWYAHLSSFIANVGDRLGAGEMLGRVGATGNASGAHLHFEVRGGAAPTGSTGTGGGAATATAAQIAAADKDKDRWWDVIGKVKDFVGKAKDWWSGLRNKGGWGDMLTGTVRKVGSQLRDYINEKIPNKVKTPRFIPDINLPDNPLPDIFDAGGVWRSGTLGLNTSGRSEVVLTNENIVSITSDLARLAVSLRAMTEPIKPGAGGVMGAPLVGELHLTGRPEERREMLADATYELRKIRLGGVHARTP
jgi:murein DD-endopeptidase MepM/ murein hydrolase activator NlpD